MKKALSLILVLALAVSMLCTAAFAEGSKSDVFSTVGAASKTDLITSVAITETESTLDAVTTEELGAALTTALAEASEELTAALAEVAEKLGVEAIAAEDLVVVAQRDFTAEEYPVVVKFFGEGTEDVVVCVFVKYEGADDWTLLYAGNGGEFEVEFEAAGTYAITVVAE